MSPLQTIQGKGLRLLRRSLRTTHSRIITCGLLVIGLFYLPQWLSFLGHDLIKGSSSPLLNVGLLYLGLQDIWQRRRKFSHLTASEEDRWLGYLLILAGIAISPFVLSSLSLQWFLVVAIIVGIGFSAWGFGFFRRCPLPIALLLISVYPNLLFLGNVTRRSIFPNALESSMAWMGSLAMQAIGQPATAQGTILSLSLTMAADKSVEVKDACSGFDMAFILAGAGLVLGLFLKQKLPTIAWLMVLGAILALGLNIPRIMLLTFAAVYWGKSSFEFWHGSIGGQIFAGIMFTIYYYLAMWIVERQSRKV